MATENTEGTDPAQGGAPQPTATVISPAFPVHGEGGPRPAEGVVEGAGQAALT